MTYFFAEPTAADLGPRNAFGTFAIRATAAVRAALASAKARGDYRQMLDREDHFLRDVGLTRADMRKAYLKSLGQG